MSASSEGAYRALFLNTSVGLALAISLQQQRLSQNQSRGVVDE
jgi:hypothetical protein